MRVACFVVMMVLAAPAAAQTAKIDAAKAQEIAAEDKAVALVADPVRSFLADATAACADKRLAEGAAMGFYMIGRAASSIARGSALQSRLIVKLGAAVLDAGDGARRRGCKLEAARIYEDVLRVFSGSSYAGLRDRATTGLLLMR